ncbi:relaxase/mobilization nuclease domain-containing protein [Nitratireductor sp. StC3]|uniref:relaxase/mobilization nuclease domain-containing protein n=1 Tax=Nitratireductor sp. StC3 TaxID=2126741 RepID=UPI000D0DC58B|nr:relaxase/mobilization nuclease domain-containing protein [Nitratireductor sp. StC3]PSM16694.1 relaxase [Nitratireductor sp. StC3]
MILQGSQRGGGRNLAAHLLRTDENEHVTLHEIRGFASNDLREAFKETEAISKGTKCRQYLFSLSLNPPEGERVPVDVFMNAIERTEKRLGLEGQPRAIVLHEKEARRHAHCVWGRIDAETMTAKQLSFFKGKLREVSRELFLENGWQLPRGLQNPAERNPVNFTLAEWQQAKRQGMDPRWIKSTLQHCWTHADDRKALARGMEEHGFFLARGDRRGFVAVDHTGEVWSLPRMLGLKTKDVRARLGEGTGLPGVDAVRADIGKRMTPAIRRHMAESRAQFRARSNQLGAYKEEMTRHHRTARTALDERQKREWEDSTRERATRLPKGLRGLWHRLTGKYQEARRLNEAEALAQRERQKDERQALIEKHLEQRAVLQAQFRELRTRQAERLLELRRDVGRYLNFARGDPGHAPGREQSPGLGLER